MLFFYLMIWIYCFNHTNNLSFLWMILLATNIIGFIGLLFHETAHFTGFKNQKLNEFISNYIAFPFLSINEWKERHNYLHHCFTNTEYDEDFDKNKFLLRHSSNHPHFIHHKLQYLYVSILFILNGFNIKIKKNAPLSDHSPLLAIIFLCYWFGIINVCILMGSIGFGYTFIANLSHIQQECIQNTSTENKTDFLYNQVSSSINYKTDNPIIRFITLGLDIQIEHHLFPNIPHSSLRKIQHIIHDYCKKNEIPYIEKPSIFPAIKSYINYLYKMGNR
jgi:linoleoyl-CoA desaturase